MYKIFLILFLAINIFALTPTQEKLNFDLQRYSYIGDLEKVKKALKDGAELDNNSISYRMTPLLQAGFKNRQEVVKYLLSKGAKKNIQSHSGRNILNYAVQNNELGFTKYLIKNGVEIVNFENETQDILFTAVEDSYLEIVKYLLPMFKNLDRYYYINRDSVWDSVKTTLLITAIQNDNIKIARLLISRGADINLKNNKQEAPILTAMRNKHYNFAKELLNLGADSSVVDIAGNSVLSYALKASKEDIALTVLKNKNFDIHQHLDTQTFNSKPFIYEYYITQVKDEWKMFNYLHMAARFGMSKVVQKLLDMGMNIDETSKKSTLCLDAIGWAAWWGHLETLKLLEKNGANNYVIYKNYNPQGQYGLAYAAGAASKYTLLSLAVISQNKNKKLIEYLLNKQDSKKYALLDTSYFYNNILSYTSQSKKDSIYNKVLEYLNRWNYPNKEELASNFKYLQNIKKSSSTSKNINSVENKLNKSIEETLPSSIIRWIKDKELIYKILQKIKTQGGDINKIIDLKYKYTLTPLLMHLLDEDKYNEKFVKKLLKLGSTLSEDKNNKIADYMLYRIYTTYSYTNFKYIINSPLLKEKVAILYTKSDLTKLILTIYKDSHTSNYRIEDILEYVYHNSLHVDTTTLLEKIKDKKIRKILRFYQ